LAAWVDLPTNWSVIVDRKDPIPTALQTVKRFSRLPPSVTNWGDCVGYSSEGICTIFHQAAKTLGFLKHLTILDSVTLIMLHKELVKLFLCLAKYHIMKMYGKWRYSSIYS
jgi:hypothetical protein